MSLKYKALTKKKLVDDFSRYDVVLSPVVTEKSTFNSQHNQVTFKVAVDASKIQIKQAVESIFNVKVKGVNTINVQGKTKRFKGVLGKRKDVKKAVVSLVEGHTIDVSTGI